MNVNRRQTVPQNGIGKSHRIADNGAQFGGRLKNKNNRKDSMFEQKKFLFNKLSFVSSFKQLILVLANLSFDN